MLSGFQTNDVAAARAALLVYAVYRSRDKRRGPSGTDMWGQIERFTRSAAKRALTAGEFIASFKRKMACDTISPRYTATDELPMPNDYGEIVVDSGKRTFLQEITELPPEAQYDIVELLYRETPRVILLVRARLEDERPIEAQMGAEDDNGQGL